MKMLVEYIEVSVARPILGRSGVQMISSAVKETRAATSRRACSAASPHRVGEACLAEAEFSKAPVGNSAWIKETAMPCLRVRDSHCWPRRPALGPQPDPRDPVHMLETASADTRSAPVSLAWAAIQTTLVERGWSLARSEAAILE